ncbi:hypothetical protein [Rhizohabitans arisaemae]|uniref:hypothetical protein n=1 Tax=Rhizohabitans arisaemae TaxID=2720610 RepID=UPI0024B0D21A|nr:hypothetical protein [Rhizohabitans arisaemae]
MEAVEGHGDDAAARAPGVGQQFVLVVLIAPEACGKCIEGWSTAMSPWSGRLSSS